MALFAQLSASCAPGDSVDTLASVARVESKFNSLAIHDNSTGATLLPASLEAAEQSAEALIVDDGHSVDLGLMQINSANLSLLGLSIADTFDACRSIAAGAVVLRDGYQRALRAAFSYYNTGDPVRGISNGYVGRVEAARLKLPDLARSIPADEPHIVLSTAATVLDMLHNDASPDVRPGEVVDLLPTIPKPVE